MSWNDLLTDFTRRLLSREAIAAIALVVMETLNEGTDMTAAALISVILGRSAVKLGAIWNDQRTDKEQVP